MYTGLLHLLAQMFAGLPDPFSEPVLTPLPYGK